MTFALVHGAFHGAWCFELLENELHQRGESTFSMDMPIDDPDLGAADYATGSRRLAQATWTTTSSSSATRWAAS